MNWTPDLEPALRRRVASFAPETASETAASGAAVALVVVPDEEGRACVVLTQRAFHLRRHAGQYALPGGKIDPGETPEQAALREVREEIDLDLDEGRILGRLDDFVTRSGFTMTPIAVWGPRDAQMRPNPDEVAVIHRVPLDVLADPATLHRMPDGAGGEMISLAIVGTYVFAPTAAILRQFAELVVHDRTLRVADAAQPRFAWS